MAGMGDQPPPAAAATPGPLSSGASAGRFVNGFRQILLWPLQLIPDGDDTRGQSRRWERLARPEGGMASAWAEIDDEFPEDSSAFQERHYREFVSFLPHVQQLLYGPRVAHAEGRRLGESPIRVFRRRDISQARITLDAGQPAVLADVVHVDLYFFYDIDVVILAVEIDARKLALDVVQDLMHRLGRAYPAGWTASGAPLHCPALVEWLDSEGRVLARSDYERRERFLDSVCRHQAPAMAAHWEFLLAPWSSTTATRQDPCDTA